MKSTFHKGQRWISDSEPELGLGSVERSSRLTVTLHFGASGETREYARDNAPLRRVRFHPGDTVKDRDGHAFTITFVQERDGLLHYRADADEFCETALSDAISFNKPEERLFAGHKVFEPSGPPVLRRAKRSPSDGVPCTRGRR